MNCERGPFFTRVPETHRIPLILLRVPAETISIILARPRLKQCLSDLMWVAQIRRNLEIAQTGWKLTPWNSDESLQKVLVSLAEHHDERSRIQSALALSRHFRRQGCRKRGRCWFFTEFSCIITVFGAV